MERERERERERACRILATHMQVFVGRPVIFMETG
jgi:hypothetical protein